MTDELTCTECGADIESADDLDRQEIDELEVDQDGSFSLYGNNDLYLCKSCKKPLGVGYSNS